MTQKESLHHVVNDADPLSIRIQMKKTEAFPSDNIGLVSDFVNYCFAFSKAHFSLFL